MAKKPSPRAAPDVATPAEGLRRTAAPSTGKTSRVESASKFADLLGVSCATVAKCIRDSMPTEGDEPAPGKPYLIDIGVAARCLQGQAAAEAKIQKLSTGSQTASERAAVGHPGSDGQFWPKP